MEKMSVAAQAETRATLYADALKGIEASGLETETIAEGALIHLPEGYFAKLAITICDATKFDLEATREKYQEKVANATARAEKAAAKAREKAEKAAKASSKED